MIFQYDVQEIDEKLYIVGSRLTSENGNPTEEHEFSQPFTEDFADENGKLQWTIRDNPDYNPETDHIDDRYLIENKSIPLTAEEIETKRLMEVKAKISAELPDLIYANKDTPAALAAAMCDRVKEIDAETTIEPTPVKELER